MTEGLKATRLSKAAREFNVGISTIVDFLHKKGFEVDSNPNTKIPPEAYSLLIKEYSSDLNFKKESEKLILNELARRKESLSLDEDSGEIVEEHSEPVAAPQKKEEPPLKKEVIAEKEEKTTKKAEEEKSQAEEKVAEEEKKDTKRSVGPTVVGKIDLDKIQGKKPAPKEKTEIKADSEASKAVDKEIPVKESPAEPKKSPEITEKKAEAEKEKETPEKVEPSADKGADKPEDGKAEPKVEEEAEDKQEFIKTKFQKLSGPTVVGRIELPTVEEKKKAQYKKPASDDEDDQKKRRKRIRKDKERVSLKTPVVDRRGDQKRKKKATIRPEISEEDVQ